MPKPHSQEVRNQARKLIEDDLITQQQTAELLGIERTTIQRWCYQFGWKTQRTGPRSGAGHPDWNGGVTIRKGYRYLYRPDHPNAIGVYVAEHRLVMEQKLGRYLQRSEVVHHMDGNPLNNSIDNLMLFQTNSRHLKHELTGKIPKWSDSGKRRIAAGVERAAEIHRKLGRRGYQHPRTSGHQPL